MIRPRVIKKKSKFQKQIAQLMLINNERVQIGHFKSQGLHSSGLSYVELMKLHHAGYEASQGVFVPPRPVIDILGFKVRGLKNTVIRRAVTSWSKRKFSAASHRRLLSEIGIAIAKVEKSIFGDPLLLESNSPLTISIKGKNTPLVDSGELRDKVAYKTSIDGIVREV